MSTLLQLFGPLRYAFGQPIGALEANAVIAGVGLGVVVLAFPDRKRDRRLAERGARAEAPLVLLSGPGGLAPEHPPRPPAQGAHGRQILDRPRARLPEHLRRYAHVLEDMEDEGGQAMDDLF